MTRRSGFSLVVWTIALAIVLGVSPARANITNGTLYLGSLGSGNQGGSFDPSSWQPGGIGPLQSLAFLYCLDIPDHVTLGTTYTKTNATNDGTVTMSVPKESTAVGPPFQDDSALVDPYSNQVAGQIAWLLNQYGTGGQNTVAVEGLQEAIWTVVYGQKFTGFGTEVVGAAAQQAADLKALGYVDNGDGTFTRGPKPLWSDPSQYLWFSPSDTHPCGGPSPSCTTGTEPFQALVGSVPDGGVTLMLLGGALVGLETLRRKLRV